MPGQLDGIRVAVLQEAPIGRSETVRLGILHRQARQPGEEFGKMHGQGPASW